MDNIQGTSEDIRPPQPPGLVVWVQENLINGWFNSILTIVLVPFTIWVLINVAQWVFITADWRAVAQFPLLYAVGQYPRAELWRVGVGLSGIIFLFGASWGKWGGIMRSVGIAFGVILALFAIMPVSHPVLTPSMRLYLGGNVLLLLVGNLLSRLHWVKIRYIVIGWAIIPILTIFMLTGFTNSRVLPKVATTLWGGLLVTFLLSAGGILLSFPIGVLLALGRRSSLPVVKIFSTIFIETIRGVPLITILFMFSIILALFLPAESRIDRLVRALMAVTFFSAAYSAENVRGGLQAVSQGQIEAAKAVGMNGFQTLVLIVLPQALRAVLPAIVGQFIALFKDTTLVVIVGINDLLGIGRSIINSDPEYVQLQLEVYLFIAVIYWFFSYLMSLASRRLEEAMGVSTKL